ncbi:MAG: endo alpha-1,4 polygalactosaminidase [Victivallales bacterium]|nr:endo alpha-1,4 polygalactosaminidase [Victivallales bacterium]
MKKLHIRILLLLNLLFPYAAKSSEGTKTFAVYYGGNADVADFKNFDLVVLDSSYTQIIQQLKQQSKTVLAYLSLGEVNRSRDYFDIVESEGLLLKPNPNWEGAYLVDVRKAAWREFVITQILPDILDKGFNGIFIDTLDSPLEEERANPKEFKGMVESSIKLIKAIRKKFPKIKIMLNRAYAIAPQVGGQINYLMAESIFYTYDFKSKKYIPVSEPLYVQQKNILQNFRRRFPAVQIVTLDYCEESDQKLRTQIYKQQRDNGFIPYVSTINLDKLVQE